MDEWLAAVGAWRSSSPIEATERAESDADWDAFVWETGALRDAVWRWAAATLQLKN